MVIWMKIRRNKQQRRLVHSRLL